MPSTKELIKNSCSKNFAKKKVETKYRFLEAISHHRIRASGSFSFFENLLSAEWNLWWISYIQI